MSRPSSWSPEVQDLVVEAIRLGASLRLAAQHAGISYATFRRWVTAGTREPDGPYGGFLGAVEQAEAHAAMKSLAVVDKAAENGSWQAATWRLAHRFPKEYGAKAKHHRPGSLKRSLKRPEDWLTDTEPPAPAPQDHHQ